MNMFKLTVFIEHLLKKYPEDILLPSRSLSVHLMANLLFNMMNVVCSEYIYAKHIHTIQNKLQESNYLKGLPTLKVYNNFMCNQCFWSLNHSL